MSQAQETPRPLFGDLAVLAFLAVQFLDGVLTYIGIGIWGVGIEANPLVSSAVMLAGPEAGLAGAKLIAIAGGILLHLRQIHRAVFLLTAFYVVVAIVPWTALLFFGG